MNFRILAFNTVTESCSVAVMINQEVYSNTVIVPRFHAEKILPMINQLLIDSGITLQSLDCIVCDQGPGSFVGVRLGISIAQGLALGADVPLVVVSSLEVLAQRAWRIFSAQDVISTIDARMNDLYWASYSRDMYNDSWIRRENARLINTVIAKKLIYTLNGTWGIVGTGWNNTQELKSYINDSGSFFLKKVMLPEAQDMLSLAICACKKKIFFTPEQVRPMYLRTNIIKK